MNASVRHVPACPKLSASLPSGFLIAVEVRNTMIASGTRMTAIVLNWRRRYAEAPSWIALAISFIFGVPSSCAMTFFASKAHDDGDERCTAGENSTAHSPPLRMKSW